MRAYEEKCKSPIGDIVRVEIIQYFSHVADRSIIDRDGYLKLSSVSATQFAGMDLRMRKTVMDSLRTDGLADYVSFDKPMSGRGGRQREAWVAVRAEVDDEAA